MTVLALFSAIGKLAVNPAVQSAVEEAITAVVHIASKAKPASVPPQANPAPTETPAP